MQSIADPAVVRVPFGASMECYTGVQGGVYYLVETMPQFREFMKELREQRVIAVDTETSGLNWVHAHACGIVIGWGVTRNFYLPIAHKCGRNLDLADIISDLSEVLEDTSVIKVFWNAKFDCHFLKTAGMEVKGVVHDGVVMVHLLDENSSKKLKDLSKKRISNAADKWEIELKQWRLNEAKRRRKEFGQIVIKEVKDRRPELEAKYFPMVKFSGLKKNQITARLKECIRKELADHPLAKNKKDDVTYDYVPLDLMTPYACADVHYTLILYKSLLTQIAGHGDLKRLYVNEMRLSGLLFDVERRGVKVDVPYLHGLEPVFQKLVDESAADVYADIGSKFDISSNRQLIDALSKMGVRLTKLTKGGREFVKNGGRPEPKHFSVDNDTLEALASEHPFATKIQVYRSKQKLLNTYVMKIQALVDDEHYLHTSFNANVSTGRMSSRDPNLQNIPGRDLSIRRAFTIPEQLGHEGEDVDDSEYVYVFMDYSQVELRLTAHHSQDPSLLAAYPWDAPSQDVHSITCAEAVMGMTTAEFMAVYNDESHPDYKDYKWYRNIAKRVNFGIIYGAQEGAIQRQVSTPDRPVTRRECKEYIARYFEKYPGVRSWIDRTTYALGKHGYLQNTFGRFRRLEDANSREDWKRERAGRQGVNFLIQGDAADLFKHAAVRVDDILKKANAKTKIVNFVHDEIQLYWHKDEFHLLQPIKDAMEDFPQFSVPIVVDIEISKRDWSEKKNL